MIDHPSIHNIVRADQTGVTIPVVLVVFSPMLLLSIGDVVNASMPTDCITKLRQISAIDLELTMIDWRRMTCYAKG